MLRLCPLLPTLAVLLPGMCASAAAPDMSGKFTIFLSGKPFGSETYAITSANGLITLDGSGSADMGVVKINIQDFQVITDMNYNPVEATAKGQMGKAQMSVKVTFAAETAESTSDTGQGEAVKQHKVHSGDVVVNYPLPLFPWSLLMPRVKLDSAEPQQFYAFITGQTAEEPLTVVAKGQEPVEFANKTVRLYHISGSMPTPAGSSINADFWIDENRRIIKIVAPGQNVEVYQDGFERKAPPAASNPETSPTPTPGRPPLK